MFGNLSEMGKMFEALQSQAKAMEEELSERRYTVKSGGGMVKLTLNGKGEAIDLEIDDSLLEDKASLQIILLSAVTDAYKMVEDNKKQHALGMLGGMNPFTK
ncbi:MAG: YbaB/EbfC family nucleoid-associated protein [Campylobacterota bacterium]